MALGRGKLIGVIGDEDTCVGQCPRAIGMGGALRLGWATGPSAAAIKG